MLVVCLGVCGRCVYKQLDKQEWALVECIQACSKHNPFQRIFRIHRRTLRSIPCVPLDISYVHQT